MIEGENVPSVMIEMHVKLHRKYKIVAPAAVISRQTGIPVHELLKGYPDDYDSVLSDWAEDVDFMHATPGIDVMEDSTNWTEIQEYLIDEE